MDNGDVFGALEEASEALVFADPHDLPALAELHTKLERVRVDAERDGSPDVAAAAQACANLVERIVLEEVAYPARALEVVGETLGALQSVVRDGRAASEVSFAVYRFVDGPGESPAVPEVAVPAEPEAAADREEGAPAASPVAWEEEAPEEDLSPVALQGDASLLGEFVAEAREHLDAADVHLLTLETDPKSAEALNAVFRAFHTIKGVAGFLALEDIQRVAHEAENLLDRSRKGAVELRGPAIDLTFDAVDLLKRLVEHVEQALGSGGLLAREPGMSSLIRRLKAVAAGAPVQVEPPPLVDEARGRKLGEVLVENGVATPETVADALRRQLLPPEHRKIGEILVESVVAPRAAVEEALEIQREHPERGRLGEILVQTGAIRERDLDTCLAKQSNTTEPAPLGEILVRSGVPAKEVAQALRGQQEAGAVKEQVKVDADRLDRLVDLIGELVIAESMVSQSPEMRSHTSNQLLRHLNQLDKITRELQEIGTSLRMVPIRSAFQKMARLARDVAKKSGRQVEFVTVGEDTELDKTVVDKIGDPLVHMVRNAVDHGLEASAEERAAAGKPAAGRVELRAFHKGGGIYIEIEDDGRGLDRDAILAKGVERGLVKEGETLTDRQICDLIFQPGFSTAKAVTDVSGRGVGMDVVKRNIDALRGQVELRTERGVGTTFSIRLPLTLAIIDGMVIMVGTERYVIPTLSIVRSIRPRAEDLSKMAGKGEMLMIQGRLLPLFRLGRLFDIPSRHEDLTEGLVVVAESDGRQVGLAVDQLLGQQQIVIKSLGDAVQRIPGIAGGAIMPDGQVGLILDVAGLVRLAHGETTNAPQGPWMEEGSELCRQTA